MKSFSTFTHLGSVLQDGNSTTCLTMNDPASPHLTYTTLGTINLFHGDVNDKFINIEMTTSDVTSCRDTDTLLTKANSSLSCEEDIFRKCKLFEDRLGESICVWRCLCDGNLLCSVEIFQRYAPYTWKLCELSIV